jgi:hypothetical protein
MVWCLFKLYADKMFIKTTCKCFQRKEKKKKKGGKEEEEKSTDRNQC